LPRFTAFSLETENLELPLKAGCPHPAAPSSAA